MSNPNPVTTGLRPFKKGESGNPAGRPRGSINRSTILNYLLFEADFNELDVLKVKPVWAERVRTKTLYELMSIAMAVRALSGDVQAFNALNKAISESLKGVSEQTTDVVHIYVPKKLSSIDKVNAQGAELRKRAELAASLPL